MDIGPVVDASAGGGLFADIPVTGGARRFVLAENGMVVPGNRVYLTYHTYHNAYLADNGLAFNDFDVSRYTLGLERTSSCGLASVEARLPFGDSYSLRASGLVTDEIEGDSGVGNLGLAAKFLLVARPRFGLSAGLHASFPTAPDVSGVAVSEFDFKNRAVHFGPLLGFFTESCDQRIFTQGIAQFDFDVTGNKITSGGALVGRLQDQSVVFVDLSLGTWLYRDPSATDITGVLALVEAHYAGTLDEDAVSVPLVVPAFLTESRHIVDLTFALHVETRRFDVRTGLSFPVTDDRSFDAEFGVQFSYWFGRCHQRRTRSCPCDECRTCPPVPPLHTSRRSYPVRGSSAPLDSTASLR
jgi:hypothetical protein